jgi:hypothetical protein
MSSQWSLPFTFRPALSFGISDVCYVCYISCPLHLDFIIIIICAANYESPRYQVFSSPCSQTPPVEHSAWNGTTDLLATCPRQLLTVSNFSLQRLVSSAPRRHRRPGIKWHENKKQACKGRC